MGENPTSYNLYAYCGNNPVMCLLSTQGHTQTTKSVMGNRSEQKIYHSVYGGSAGSQANKSFGFVSAQLRSSSGWNTSPTIATSFFGRIGYSFFITETKGNNGLLYAVSGSTIDSMNWFGAEYFVGFGINLWNVVGAEFQLKTVGIGSSVNAFGYSVSFDINLIGGTSVTFGHTTNIGEGMSRTEAFTIGINTGCLVAAAYWVYKFFQTGDPSPVPGWQPI